MYYAALIIIALIFIWRMTVGFRKGMVQEIISLIAMAVAGSKCNEQDRIFSYSIFREPSAGVRRQCPEKIIP